MIGIYKIVNKTNGKCYVGQSKNIESRWKKHIRDSRSEKRPNYKYPLYCAFRKYGIENFEFNVLEELQSRKNITEREQHWYEVLSPKYNQIEPREVTTVSVPVYQIDKKTLEVVAEHKSMLEASKSLGLKGNALSSVFNKKKPNISAGGYYWCKVDEHHSWEQPFPKKRDKHNGREVIQYDLKTGETVKTYLSLIVVGKVFNCRWERISECCRSKRDNYLGFGWRYSEQSLNNYRTMEVVA